jgi:hypothetical protein
MRHLDQGIGGESRQGSHQSNKQWAVSFFERQKEIQRELFNPKSNSRKTALETQVVGSRQIGVQFQEWPSASSTSKLSQGGSAFRVTAGQQRKTRMAVSPGRGSGKLADCARQSGWAARRIDWPGGTKGRPLPLSWE